MVDCSPDYIWSFPSGSAVKKEFAFNAGAAGAMGSIQVWKDPLEKEMANLSSILAWRIPWTEELGGLQSIGLQGQM